MTDFDSAARLAVEGLAGVQAHENWLENGPLNKRFDHEYGKAPWGSGGARIITFSHNDNRRVGRGDYISTFTGRFYPMDPRASEVNIKDIAHSLSMQCRYAGHGKRFYSVAEHSVLLARYVSAPNKLAALLHDATEAYLVDVPRPVKRALTGYKDAEARVWHAVAAAFGLSPMLPMEVHDADNRIIADEMAQNMHEVDPSYTDPLGVELQFWPPERAELYFLDAYRKLISGNMGAVA